VVTFKNGAAADTKELIKVLQAWVRDLKKEIAAGEQDAAAAPDDEEPMPQKPSYEAGKTRTSDGRKP
jgi:hypothetical protein